MDARGIIEALERLQSKLRWLQRVEAEIGDDSFGQPAIFIRLVVQPGFHDLFEDGARLMAARRLVRAVLDARGVELWPFIAFVSADELEAA